MSSRWTLLVIASWTIAAAPVASALGNLVGYWPLDGNGNAVVGTNGTLTNGPVAAIDRNNLAGGALSFTGSSQQFVNIAGGGGINNLPAATISMWVSWNGTQDAACCGPSFGNVIARQNNGIFSNNIIGLSTNNPATANITLHPYGATPITISAGGPVGTGYHHIVATMASGSQQLYVDGVLVGSAVAGVLSNSAATPLTIGAWAGDGGGFSTSRIDEVGTFDQALPTGKAVALHSAAVNPELQYTLDEIEQLFDAFDAQGEVTIGELTWQFATPQELADAGALGGLGQVTNQGGQFGLLFDSNVGGLLTAAVPEPASVAVWGAMAFAVVGYCLRQRRKIASR